MSNVQTSKVHATRKLSHAVTSFGTSTALTNSTQKGLDFTVVESASSSLYECSCVRYMRTCLRSWYLHFAGYNIDMGASDGYNFLELDRFVGELIDNCVYEENTVAGIRTLVHNFQQSHTEGEDATISEAKKMRKAMIEWFAHTINDFENRADELPSFTHMDAFNTLDSILILVIGAHEDGIKLYAPANADAAA